MNLKQYYLKNKTRMNKTTATYNASDVYEKWVDKFLQEHPECWTSGNRSTRRRREFIFRSRKIRLRGKKVDNQGMEVEEVMRFLRYMRIVKLYYLIARREVIKGEKVRLGHRLGCIRARTVSRNWKKKRIDWNATKKQPLIEDPITGKKRRERIIYHTSETYCRIGWERVKSITNETYYKFTPSKVKGGTAGFKGDFKRALKENPLLATKYKQYIYDPIID